MAPVRCPCSRLATVHGVPLRCKNIVQGARLKCKEHVTL